MRFFLRTAYGNSDRSYGSSCDDLPFQGVCQGNGAGPALWLAVSITLVNLLRSHGHLATFQSPISGQSISITGLLYVDDCDLVAYSPPHPMGPVSTIGKLQRNVTLWQGSLRATGGNLSLKKCTWSILAMHKQGHKWRPHTIHSLLGQLSVQNSQQTSINIRRIEHSHGLEVVGVVQSLSGNSTPAAQALKEKAQKWITALQSGFLPRHMTWTALKCVIWPSLRYPLCVTTMSPCQLQQATAKLFQAILPKLGTNRNYPMALRSALPLHHGLGLPNPVWEQGIMAIKLFLEHANTSRMENTLIMTSMEYMQLQIGSSLPVFDTNFSKWGFLAEPTWITSIWEFLSTHRIQL